MKPKLTRSESYVRKYGPVWGPVVLSSKAAVAAAARHHGEGSQLDGERERHAALMASLGH